MEMTCTECGCLVDRGEVVRRCSTEECCCRDLPDRSCQSPSADISFDFMASSSDIVRCLGPSD